MLCFDAYFNKFWNGTHCCKIGVISISLGYLFIELYIDLFYSLKSINGVCKHVESKRDVKTAFILKMLIGSVTSHLKFLTWNSPGPCFATFEVDQIREDQLHPRSEDVKASDST